MAKKLPDVDPMSFLPLRYQDMRSAVASIHFKEGEKILAAGKVLNMDIRTTTKGDLMVVTMQDEYGHFFIKIFNYKPFHKRLYQQTGRKLHIWGDPKKEIDGWCFYFPELAEQIGEILPVYRCPSMISQDRLRKHVWLTTEKLIETITDEVSDEILRRWSLPKIADALRMIHNPTDGLPDNAAYKRLAYREIFHIKQQIQEFPKYPAPVMEADLDEFYDMLPFELTYDQKKAIKEISEDMKKGQGARRILIGDVGSGKTCVAQAAAYIAYKCNYRTLVLAPTIVLAGQLYDKFVEVFGSEAVSIYTGEVKTAPSMIIVGTHALLNTQFSGVGLVIMDEQHRYGVMQRQKLLGEVHALQMTATPIPRSVNLIMRGAIDVSTLLESPYKRDVVTKVVPVDEKPRILGHIRHVVNNGQKVLIIYPLVEEAKGEYKAVEQIKDVWEKLFPQRVMFVHGKLDMKLEIVNMFRKSKTHQILVSTSLIETGLDIPEAVMLIVSGSEKFGISQLHQLRGRIGRRGDRSFCYYIYKNPDRAEKLKYLETVTDGMQLAEIDSDIRGWGEVFGYSQTGNCLNFTNMDIYKRVIEMVTYDLQEKDILSLRVSKQEGNITLNNEMEEITCLTN